jgi:hypothetical protein
MKIVGAGADTDKLTKALPRPAAEVLREYMDFHTRQLALNPSLVEILKEKDAPERKYRWLVELDCRCITEALTAGEDRLPTTGVAPHRLGDHDKPIHPTYAQTYLMSHNNVRCTDDRVGECACFPPGLLWCSDHGEKLPWREITEWVKRRRERPAHYTDNNKEMPATAEWLVKLSCGHRDTVFTEVNWIPEYGHQEVDEVKPLRERLRRTTTDEQRAEELEWTIRLIRHSPPTERECNRCVYERRIVAQRLIGPLPKQRQRRPRVVSEPSETTLKQAEARASRLRRELAQAEAEADRLRRTANADPSCPPGR